MLYAVYHQATPVSQPYTVRADAVQACEQAVIEWYKTIEASQPVYTVPYHVQAVRL